MVIMALSQAELLEKAKGVQLLAMDVDGVLTAGEIIYTEDGRELKVFNVKDGHGLAMWTHAGLEAAIITGRSSHIVQKRANELKINHVFQGIKSKLPVLEALTEQLGISLAHVAYIGDDTPDIEVLQAVGLSVCPKDAMPVVKAVCHWVTSYPGGKGAVREVTDLIMNAQSLLDLAGNLIPERLYR